MSPLPSQSVSVICVATQGLLSRGRFAYIEAQQQISASHPWVFWCWEGAARVAYEVAMWNASKFLQKWKIPEAIQ